MKIFKKNYKFIFVLGIVVGAAFASIGAYAATSYAIDSSKIGYKDNSNLGVDNVQAAIDGTCSNINTKLSGIENDIDNINSGLASGHSKATCESDVECIIATIPLNSNSVYLLEAQVRAITNHARVITAGFRTTGTTGQILGFQTAGVIDQNIYPYVTLTKIITGDTSIDIVGKQNAGFSAEMDTFYNLIKLK
ncbi:MAG: hypothetical protein J6A17_00970 [Bacilli bacterium]|nr:hypothetical protein [Bacilli bacterium]